MNIDTLLVHAGEKPDPITGAVAPPLIRTKTYKQKFGEKPEYDYSRAKNPTRTILENKLAEIESPDGTARATVFSSGLSAETMFFLTLNPGDHIIIQNEVYGGTYRLLSKILNRFGINFTQVDFDNRENINKAITSKTKYFFIESLTNPSLNVTDFDSIQSLSKETNIPFVADMTFTPPCAIRAFNYGAKVIIHSLSKYYAGHNDVLGGTIVTKDLQLDEQLRFLQKSIGAVLSPDECYRTIQGIKTLNVRWKHQSESALVIANYLNKQEKVERVLYPGLLSHPNHNKAMKQFTCNSGGVLSFELKTKEPEKVKTFVENLQKSGNIIYGESLASTETLLAYPYTMSHGSLTDEQKEKLGISRSFFRLSLGLEDFFDIKNDLEYALSTI